MDLCYLPPITTSPPCRSSEKRLGEAKTKNCNLTVLFNIRNVKQFCIRFKRNSRRFPTKTSTNQRARSCDVIMLNRKTKLGSCLEICRCATIRVYCSFTHCSALFTNCFVFCAQQDDPASNGFGYWTKHKLSTWIHCDTQRSSDFY